MRRTLITILLSGITLMLSAQTPYTERLQKEEPGKGKVLIHQSKTLADLVNGVVSESVVEKVIKAVTSLVSPESKNEETEEPAAAPTPTTKVRMNGYRIQVYSGGNSRQAKSEASMMGNRVKSMFGDLSVYTNFASPHWICRVGDFRTYEEANEVYRQLKETGRFREAVIVKSKVNVSY